MRFRVTRPFFAAPPAEYRQSYMADIVRSFSQALEQLYNPGQGRFTFIVLTDLQTDDVDLEPGAVYRLGRQLYVSTLDAASLRGASMTSGTGTVTVTIT